MLHKVKSLDGDKLISKHNIRVLITYTVYFRKGTLIIYLSTKLKNQINHRENLLRIITIYLSHLRFYYRDVTNVVLFHIIETKLLVKIHGYRHHSVIKSTIGIIYNKGKRLRISLINRDIPSKLNTLTSMS